MSGVTWDERKEGMWLASNGRWYPASQYPVGWNMTALPPAPGQAEHGVASEVLRRMRGVIETQTPPDLSPAAIPDSFKPAPEQTAGNDPWAGAAQAPPRPTSTAPPARRSTSAPVRRPSPPPPASATVTRQSTYSERLPSAPPAPKSIGAPPPRTKTPPPPSSSKTVVAGDLGAVFGAARAKIEKAINEAELK